MMFTRAYINNQLSKVTDVRIEYPQGILKHVCISCHGLEAKQPRILRLEADSRKAKLKIQLLQTLLVQNVKHISLREYTWLFEVLEVISDSIGILLPDAHWDNPPWYTVEVKRIARSILETGSYSDQPILADAIEDAGCCDRELLAALRMSKKRTTAFDYVLGFKGTHA